MEYDVRHRTTYRYATDVSYSCHISHLMPRETATQHVEQAETSLSLSPSRRHGLNDYFGNVVEWFAIDQPHTVLEILLQARVEVKPAAPLAENSGATWEDVKAMLDTALTKETRGAVQYLFDSPLVRMQSTIAAYAAKSFPARRPIVAGSIDLMRRIHKDFRYDSTVTDASTPVERVFEIRAGVCQDLAHVGIACLRALGLAGRYVSGYLRTIPAPGQARLLGADASHAWFSVWTPDHGWVDLDPTNDMRPSEGHITLGWGRDYSDVAPVNGIVSGGGDHVVDVGVDVIPVK